jgi:hypothetical protein
VDSRVAAAPHKSTAAGGGVAPAPVRAEPGRPIGGRMAVAALVLAVGALSGCGGDDDGDGVDDPRGGTADVAEPALRQELLDMQEADQAERTGETDAVWDDGPRTERLAEIIDEHGWPGHDLVGEDGASAAWVIAQHSDLDADFQREALDLMRDAVARDDADPTELAYLEDRVGLADGGPQMYGTQIGCVDGRAEPAELAEPDRVDDLRAEVGLEPLADYLAELADACAAEAAPPQLPEG